METARVAAARGHRVRLIERSDELGGVAAVAGPNRAIVEWLAAELTHEGVSIELGSDAAGATIGPHEVIVQATGSTQGVRTYDVRPNARVLDVLDTYLDPNLLPSDGRVVVFDPIGGPIGIAFAEHIGPRAVLITQDNIAGNELSRSGDLAPANVRLAQQGVQIERRSLLRGVATDHVLVEDKFTGEQRVIECVALVDCGFRLPTEPMPSATLQAGDCVAPRTLFEAILEGRRAALAIDQAPL